MSRRQRLDEVCCAICMDTLFNLRDDLEEVLPIAAPDCGHVFHEKCLLEWFKTQAVQYVVNAREHGLRNERGDTPTPSEAPAECPSCRAECYADPETGEPTIHRLFINFGGEDNFGASSQYGSSPFRASVRPGNIRTRDRDKEILGMARRARGLGEEVKALGAESMSEDVEGMMARAGRLQEDVISEKAVTGLKTYVGGLTAALNSLRSCIESNPVIPQLQAEIEHLRREKRKVEQQVQNTMRNIVPLEIQRALATERAKTDKRIQEIQKESEIIQRELEKAQVARRASRKAMEERERETEKRMAEVTSELRREQDEQQALRTTLLERTKLLRVYQAKAESRKALKAQFEELQNENARLKANLQQQGSSRIVPQRAYEDSTRHSSASLPRSPDPDGGSTELSVQEMAPPLDFSAKRGTEEARNQSLHVDMANTPDDSLVILPPRHTSRSAPSSRAGPSKGTARTFSFSLDNPFVLPKKQKTSHSKAHSKYFSPSSDHYDQHDVVLSDRILVDASSPEHRAPVNPFATSLDGSDSRKLFKRPAPPDSVINLAVSSPERPPLSPVKNQENRRLEKTKSVTEILGVADAQGRPKKGVVGGVKVKRRV